MPPPAGVTRFWRPKGLPGVSALRAAFTNQTFTPHSHDALVIAVTEEGHSSYTSRGRSDEAAPDRLLVFNPAEPHAGHMRHSHFWRYRALYLHEKALGRLVPATGMITLPGFSRNALELPGLIAQVLAAHAALEAGDEDEGRERLVEALGQLFTHGDRQPPPPLAATDRAGVDHTLRRIRADYQQRITIEGLAADAGLSPFQLVRQFKRHTGMAPHAHLVQVRLAHAIRRLAAGVDIATAASDAGFYDQSALTRHFKRAYGITPGHYVRARRHTG
ncbi:MAG: AraC family transcriptional regulator [Vicinamibacterales bacterium]